MKELNKDPMGRAIADYWSNGKAASKREQSDACINSAEREQARPKVKADKLRVFSPDFDEDEIPVSLLFREFEDMPEIEKTALTMAKGRVLDVGAGAGCHSLALQERGLTVTAIDISPLSVSTMKERGVRNVIQQDFFEHSGQYDTILMLMNGIGIVGTLPNMPRFFKRINDILAPEGQLLCDSSDIDYIYETEEGIIDIPPMDHYYGELIYQMQYKDTKGDSFPWLYIDPLTLAKQADENGFRVEIVKQGEHYDYLAKITRKEL